MRVVRWLSAALLGVAALTVPVAAQAAPSAPTAPYTALAMHVTPKGLDPSPGDSGAYTYADDQVVVDSFFPTFVNIRGGTDPTGDTGIGFVLYPKDGGTLTVGTLPIAYNANNDAGGLSLSIAHGSCQASAGNVVISAISFTDGAHRLTADYDVTCNGQRYQGAARISSPQGYDGADLTPGTTRYGNVDIGGTRDITYSFTPRGTTAPVTIGLVALSTTTTASFETTADTCSHAVLAYGVACTVTVRAAPLEAGDLSVVVTFPTTAGASYASAITLTAIDPVGGTYYPTEPQRVLDTRTGNGIRKGPIGPGQAYNFYPLRFTQQQASAVVLNITVDRPSTSGYVTLYPGGTARPRTSSVNFTRGWTGANLVTVPLRANDQRVTVFNSAGATSVIADVVGYYGADDDDSTYPRGGGYHPTNVQRILDTRTAGYGQLPGGYYASIPVRYQGDGRHIAALSVTVTAVNMTGPGYLTTWNGYYDAPGTSTLNYTKASGVVSNAAVVPTSYCPPDVPCNADAWIAVQNQGGGPVDVVVDINGYYDDGNLAANVRFKPLAAPTRIVDTRTALGTGRFGAKSTHTIAAPSSVAGIDTIALDANIAAVAPTQRTYLTVWPKFDDYPRPTAAVLNPLAGQTVADHVVAEVGYGNLFNVYNAIGATDVVMDVGGTFESFPPTPPGGATGAVPHARVVVPRPSNTAGTGPTVHRA